MDSIEATLKIAEAHGAIVLRGREPISETSWWAVFQDPDGNSIVLYEGTTDVPGE